MRRQVSTELGLIKRSRMPVCGPSRLTHLFLPLLTGGTAAASWDSWHYGRLNSQYIPDSSQIARRKWPGTRCFIRDNLRGVVPSGKEASGWNCAQPCGPLGAVGNGCTPIAGWKASRPCRIGIDVALRALDQLKTGLRLATQSISFFFPAF